MIPTRLVYVSRYPLSSLFLIHRQRKRSLAFARDDDTGRTLFPHILCMIHGISIPHAVISSVARNLFLPLFPPPSQSFLGEAPPSSFSEKRCFPFLAVKHSPSCRQRKRSLDFARDDDTGNVLSHTFFVRCTGFPFPTLSFRAQREIFFVPFFPPPSQSFLGEAPPSSFSEKRCFPFLAVKHSPSCRQRKRSLDFARDDDTGNVLSHTFFVRCTGFPFPTLSFRAQREIFFVPFFPPPSQSFLGEAPPSSFSEKRCFPFLAVKHSPSCRQRKRSLGFARDDDMENVLSHTFFV